MSQRVTRRLRPSLFINFSRSQRSISSQTARQVAERNASNDYLKRVGHLEATIPRDEWYPRLLKDAEARRCSIAQFNRNQKELGQDETKAEIFSTIGRIQSIRKAGSKLAFITIREVDHILQIVLKHDCVSDLKGLLSIARKGDTYAFTGHPHRTSRGELSLLASEQPQLLSPSLHQIPEKLHDPETLSHRRHVNMLIDADVSKVLKVRHTVERTIDTFLSERDFIKVNTPILQGSAGGAIARPFETRATEFSEQQLQLRIAPELWLKRLVVGGMSRVYEIGPVFRNEGIDATHNPEFTMCEFYAAHATLDELMQWTEQLMLLLSQQTAIYNQDHKASFEEPFAQLEFLPTIEKALGHALPNLEATNALEELIELFKEHDLALPNHPSLPRLLDALCGHLIEPHCAKPTFITHHPAALSPLSKHFTCTHTGQQVAARAELFVNHCELANMYEEQNSPFEQRRLLIEQLKHRAIDGEGDSGSIDHAYLEALEWGLPPTGGWGCGIDRLVMLFAQKSRLSEVLSFGGLRNVAGVGRGK